MLLSLCQAWVLYAQTQLPCSRAVSFFCVDSGVLFDDCLQHVGELIGGDARKTFSWLCLKRIVRRFFAGGSFGFCLTTIGWIKLVECGKPVIL